MGLYQRGKYWYMDIYVGRKRIQESTGKTDQAEAQLVHDERMAEYGRGEVPEDRVTLESLSEKYMDHAKTHKRSWSRDQLMLNRLTAFFGATEKLVQITALRVERYQQRRVKEVAPATVNRELALLKHMFNLAERWGLFKGRNPVKLVKFLREDQKKFVALTADEERRLLAHCSPVLEDMVRFALNTGLRCSDIYNLKWEDVDLSKKLIHIRVKKTARLLEVPLNDAAFSVVMAWHGMRRGPYVFYNQKTGDRFKDLKAALASAVEAAKLPRVTWHVFRHSFASRLIHNGVDIMTVKELLGHSTVTVTMRYLHTTLSDKTAAVQGLGISSKNAVNSAKLDNSDKVVTVDFSRVQNFGDRAVGRP